MPFPDLRRRVTCFFQQFRQRDRFAKKKLISCIVECPRYAEPAWTTSGQNTDTRRRTDRRGRMKIGESNATFSKLVDLRRQVFRAAVTSQITIPQIIGKNEHNVRLSNRCLGHLIHPFFSLPEGKSRLKLVFQTKQ